MTKFKVGDKVRILDVSKIAVAGLDGWNDGDIAEVVSVARSGSPLIEGKKTPSPLIITKYELPYIELAPQTPTKNQRITTLESEVDELKAKVEALEKAQKRDTAIKSTVEKYSDALRKIAEYESDKRRKKMSLTPNELRKAIIAEAKAFVAKHTTPNTSSFEWNARGAIKWEGYGVIPEFHVNKEKRIVTLILKGAGALDGRVKAKFFAKCASDDVFNADIGKAIALGRALGLGVERFEQAVKPTEVVVGQVVENRYEGVHKVFAVRPAHRTYGREKGDEFIDYRNEGYTYINERDYEFWTRLPKIDRILDDTEAQY